MLADGRSFRCLLYSPVEDQPEMSVRASRQILGCQVAKAVSVTQQLRACMYSGRAISASYKIAK